MSHVTTCAGVSEVDITPPMGVEMAGYGWYEKRVCTEVLDPLYARALWLESGEEPLLIITLDLIAIDTTTRNQVVREIRAVCGIPDERVLVAASHTHSGPSVRPVIGWGERDPAYVAGLPGLVCRAAAQARNSRVSATVGACRQRVRGIGVNREQPTFGPLDTAAQLLRIDRTDGTPLAVLCNFGAHPVARYPYTSRISADWPGLVAAYVRASMPPAVAMFLQGCLGNINAHEMSFERDDPGLRQRVADMRTGDVAIRFADQILPAARALKTRGEVELDALWSWIELPCTTPDAGDLRRAIDDHAAVAESMTLNELRPLHMRLRDETDAEKAWRYARYQVDVARCQLELLEKGETVVRAPIQILKIGDAVLVGWPVEAFVELGLELRQRSPFPLTFVVGAANEDVGYIPTPAAYESQGRPNEFGKYPTSLTPQLLARLPFRPDVGRRLIEETLHLLHRL